MLIRKITIFLNWSFYCFSFKEGVKIIHFIGPAKPWLQPFDTETRLARVSGDSANIGNYVQMWWDIFCTYVHPHLNTEMVSTIHVAIWFKVVVFLRKYSNCYGFSYNYLISQLCNWLIVVFNGKKINRYTNTHTIAYHS